MPVEKESKLTQWIAAIREGWPAVRAGFDEWKSAVREEPVLIWATPAIRYSVYAVGGLIVLSLLIWALEALQPPNASPAAETGDFHVLCTEAACEHHFVINEEFGFDDFPVRCPKCEKKTGQRAMRCASSTCGGRWVVPKDRDDRYYCPYCDRDLGEVD